MVAPEERPEAVGAEARRKGLTAAERACMRRFAFTSPSPDCEAKMAVWPSHQPSPQAVAARRRKPAAVPEAVAEAEASLGTLDFMEKACGDILERLLPLPERQQRAAGSRGRRRRLTPKPSSSALSRSTPTAGRGSMSFCIDALSTTGTAPPQALSQALSLPQLPGTAAGQGTRGASSPAPPAIIAAGELQLIRRQPDWDPMATQLRRNVIRLVQGASANKVEREVGGKIRFIHTVALEEKGAGQQKEPGEGSSNSLGFAKTSGYNLKKGAQELQGHPLHLFRRKMLKRFSSLAEAFDSFNVDGSKQLDMREWCDLLGRTDMCSMFEARVIFELMDADRDGSLTMAEFNLGLETIAPVVSLVALRKRLICLGFTSMLQAIAVMDGGGEDSTMQPLTLSEFAACLRRAWVIEDHEHRAIFDLVRDPAEPQGRATLSELACGLAAVSPCILLGEARQQLEAKWGNLGAAADALQDEWLEDQGIFEEKGSEWLGMTREEAAKLFRITDIDRSGNLTRSEVIGSVRLSQPSVQMEDIRCKVQQSYRGIEAVLREAFTHEGAELDNSLRFSTEEIMEVLEPLDMGKVEKRQLVQFMQATSDQGLTLSEFFRGIRLFAPSCALEGVRLQLLRNHDRVADAFRGVRHRRAPVTLPELAELLSAAGAEVKDLDTIFDIIDVRSTGVVTVTEVIAALQGSQSGTRRWVGRKEREESAEHSVQELVGPLRAAVLEIKQGLKLGLRGVDVEGAGEDAYVQERGGLGARRPSLPLQHSRSVPTGLQVMHAAMAASSPTLAAATGWDSSPSPPLRELPRMAFARRTFQRIGKSLEKLPPEPTQWRQTTMEELGHYFVSQQQVFGQQEPVLREKYRRAALHREFEELRRLEKRLRPGAEAGAAAE